MYLSRMPATAPIMYPSTLKTNHSSMGLNWAFNTVVYKKAVMRGMRGWFFKIIKEKRNKHLFILLKSTYTTTNSTYFNYIFLSIFMNTNKGGR
jgi:hypothetical protein